MDTDTDATAPPAAWPLLPHPLATAPQLQAQATEPQLHPPAMELLPQPPATVLPPQPPATEPQLTAMAPQTLATAPQTLATVPQPTVTVLPAMALSPPAPPVPPVPPQLSHSPQDPESCHLLLPSWLFSVLHCSSHPLSMSAERRGLWLKSKTQSTTSLTE